VTALWKDGHLDRLEVQPLSEAEIAVLLEAVLGGPVDSRGAARMWALTCGNALYLRQLVDGEVESGRLSEVGGVWRWLGEREVSPGLAELVDARMGQLSERVRDVLDVLALGEPLGVALLAQLTDPTAVEDAEGCGLVRAVRDGRRLHMRLAHPLYGEVRRARIGQLRARRLRGRIASALAGVGGRRADDTLRRAVLALDSDLEPDPQQLIAAARAAVHVLDFSLAERLARAAVAAGGGFDARLALVYALGWLSRGAEVEIELAALADVVDADIERTLVTIPRVGNLFWTLRQPAEAEAVLDGAAAATTDEGSRRVLSATRPRKPRPHTPAATSPARPRRPPPGLTDWPRAVEAPVLPR
jgi:hypothetical protein